MKEYADFLEALRGIEEGDGQTLLDHTAVLCFSDCSFGKSHAIDEMPLLIGGRASGGLKGDYHYRAPSAEIASKLGFSLLRVMGL